LSELLVSVTVLTMCLVELKGGKGLLLL
jgi:hypothetical protein